MSQPDTTQSPQSLSEAIERLDAWAETLTADDFETTYDLVAIARAADAVEAAKAALEAAVANARSQDRSWNHIAQSLGVSRQAARQRFGAVGHAERARRAGAARVRSGGATAPAAEKGRDAGSQ